MSQNAKAGYQVPNRPFQASSPNFSGLPVTQGQVDPGKLNGVSTVDFHLTAKCRQACPYCWGPRRFRNTVDSETARRIIAQIKEAGVRRIVFTGGDPLFRPDALELVRYAKGLGLETALSTTGDFVTPEVLEGLAPYLDLISLPLDGSTEEINARTKHPGHHATILRALEWLRAYPGIDVKVCTPVTRHNLGDVPNIARLVQAYARTTQARVFYNVFQAFPRAMFSVNWEKLIVTDDEFAALAGQVGTVQDIRINFLDHKTLDKLYVMVFPDGSMIVPSGADYLNFGPFLEVQDFEQVLNASQFDLAKHQRHSRGWEKGAATGRVVYAGRSAQADRLQGGLSASL
jgi:sulfatase maturation enzyme AslB (radical SAM superfamily)